MKSSESSESFMDAILGELIKKYKQELPDKAAAVDAEVAKIVNALENNQPADWSELQRLCHKLAGSSGTYGLAELSQLAREIEERITEKKITQLQPADALRELKGWNSRFDDEIRKAA